MTCDTGRPYPDPDPQTPQGHDACHKSHIGAHAPHTGVDPMAESVLRALYPHSGMRRALLKSLGAQGLLAAVASLFPYRAAEAMLWDRTAPEQARRLTHKQRLLFAQVLASLVVRPSIHDPFSIL